MQNLFQIPPFFLPLPKGLHDSVDIHRQSFHRWRFSGCLCVHTRGEASSRVMVTYRCPQFSCPRLKAIILRCTTLLVLPSNYLRSRIICVCLLFIGRDDFWECLSTHSLTDLNLLDIVVSCVTTEQQEQMRRTVHSLQKGVYFHFYKMPCEMGAIDNLKKLNFDHLLKT